MIDQYIKRLQIFDLEFESSFYYIQRDYMVEKIKLTIELFIANLRELRG